jgi:hypothetical protein
MRNNKKMNKVTKLPAENSGATIYQRFELHEAITSPWYEGNMLSATPGWERKSETAFHYVYVQNRVAASQGYEQQRVRDTSNMQQQHITGPRNMEQRQPWNTSNIVRQQHADQSNTEQHLRNA